MKRYEKQPQCVDNQIKLLRKRGLEIHDEDFARNFLSRVSYYRLSSYFIPFETPFDSTENKLERCHNFIEGSSFEDIYQLYIFDKNLRLHLLEAIEKIEVAIRTLWSNALSISENNSHVYIDPKAFHCPWRHQTQLAQVAKQLNESKELFVTHYKNKYQEPFLPPIWAMTEVLSFTDLSKWVNNTKSIDVKTSLARKLGFFTPDVLNGVTQTIAYIRNICAHHARLWNRKMVKKLPNIKSLNEYLVLSDKEVSNKLYNYLVVINFILKAIDEKDCWQLKTTKLVSKLTSEQLKQMGFPEDHIFSFIHA